MKIFTLSVLASVALVGATSQGYAQNLLGGVLGGTDDTSLITLGSGDAGTSGLVNLGLGGENQVLDVNIGNGTIGSATVGSGGDNGLLDVDVTLLNQNAIVHANIGGDSLVDANVSIGGGTGGGGAGNGNGNGNDNGNGNGGGDGNGAVPVVPSGSGSAGVTCRGISSSELERLISATRINGSWQRASNVAVQAVTICPEQRSWLAAALSSSGLGHALRSAIASDALLSASIARSSYNLDRVFAVQHSGGQLTVFVY